MGTNYYAVDNRCHCCGRYDRTHHIGKSSWGWAFSFRGYREERLVSWQAWKQFLADREIRDEYGDAVSWEDFVRMIETVKAPGHVREDGHRNLQHNFEGQKPNERGHTWFNPEYDWDDDEGYAFSSREFW
jgi:hypothetical protein